MTEYSAIGALRRHIRTHGPMRFSEYMAWALYDPLYGYYTSAHPKFGWGGDFITAPERSELFSQALANQCAQVLAMLPGGSLCELGAGSGCMAEAILKHLQAIKCLPSIYFIIEISPALRHRQAHRLKSTLSKDLFQRISWVTELPKDFRGVFVGNEVIDALPVDRFMITEDGNIQLEWVDENQQGLSSIFRHAAPAEAEAIAALNIHPNAAPYHSEINFTLDQTLKRWLEPAKQAVCIWIDYGHHRAEYYRPDRTTGTLMCHHAHQAIPNPLERVGEQDITAHVDFTALAWAGLACGFEPAGFTSQAFFLLDNGLLELSQNNTSSNIEAIKALTLPGKMGEAFKVLALSKKLTLNLRGFQTRNRLDQL